MLFACKYLIWCDLYDMVPMVRLTAMGVGAQDDLGGHQKFCPKNDLIHSFRKSTRFSLKLRRFFCPNWGDLKKRTKRVFNEIETAFLSKLRWFPTEKKGVCVRMLKKILRGQNCPKNMKLPKTLTQNCPKNIKSPKILTQNCPNNMKLPKILTR